MNQKGIGTIIKLERLKQNKGQKEVCYGICVPSYLSKIENGETNAQPEIIAQLLQRLNKQVVQDEVVLQEMKGALQQCWKALLYFEKGEELISSLQKQEELFLTSVYCIDYLLVVYAYTEQEHNLLCHLEEGMSSSQKAYYYLLCALHEKQKFKDEQLKWAIQTVRNSLTILIYASYCFSISDYKKILQIEKELVETALQEGNTLAFAHYYELKGTVFGVFNQLERMQECYERALNFGKQRFDEDTLQGIYYNIGAVYVALHQSEQALYYLKQAEQNEDTLRMQVFTYLQLKDKQQVQHILEKWFTLLENNQDELSHLKYEEACMRCEKGFLEQARYVVILESILRHLPHHFGKRYVYTTQLVKAYEQQRKYKKAIQLERKLSSKVLELIV